MSDKIEISVVLEGVTVLLPVDDIVEHKRFERKGVPRIVKEVFIAKIFGLSATTQEATLLKRWMDRVYDPVTGGIGKAPDFKKVGKFEFLGMAYRLQGLWPSGGRIAGDPDATDRFLVDINLVCDVLRHRTQSDLSRTVNL